MVTGRRSLVVVHFSILPGRPEERVTRYEQAPGGNVIARITVECRSVAGTLVSVDAPLGQEPQEAVEARLHKQCGCLEQIARVGSRALPIARRPP